jgi:hypothetical protein
MQKLESEDAFDLVIYSRHATGVMLLFYSEADPANPLFEFYFQHPAHKTGSIWHCRIPANIFPMVVLQKGVTEMSPAKPGTG